MKTESIDAICTLAGVGSKKTFSGTIIYLNGRVELKVSDDERGGERGAIRLSYPKGRDYSHTTVWGRKVTDEYILAQKLKLALMVLNKELSTLAN